MKNEYIIEQKLFVTSLFASSLISFVSEFHRVVKRLHTTFSC